MIALEFVSLFQTSNFLSPCSFTFMMIDWWLVGCVVVDRLIPFGGKW